MNRWKWGEERPSPQPTMTHTAPPHPEMNSIALFTCSVCERYKTDGEQDLFWTHQSGSDAVKPKKHWKGSRTQWMQVIFASDPCGSSIQHCEKIEHASVGFVLPSEKDVGRRTGCKSSYLIVFNLNTMTASLNPNGIVGNEPNESVWQVSECPHFMKFCAFHYQDAFLLQLLSWLLYLNVLSNS